MRSAFIRSRAEAKLTDTCRIETPGTTNDFGTKNPPTVSGPVRCRKMLLFQRPMEREQGGEVVAITAWAFLVPRGTPVDPADVVIFHDERFEVVSTAQDATDHALLSVTVKRIV